MTEQSWHVARLIPTSGINGAEEQERRATSALLAVMSSVREFGRALTSPLGAPAGHLETFIEVPFNLDGKKLFPDGLIRVRRGNRTWTALIEVKTGANVLVANQLENYLDIARDNGFDALVTISNEIPSVLGQHPTVVDRRKLRKVDLFHWSWSMILTHAILQREFRGIADPDQAWILGELIRYLEHPRSGALSFDDMGESWVSVRDSLAAGTLRQSDKGAASVAARFDALIRFACLKLGRKLGTEVTPILSRREIADPNLRVSSQVSSLVAEGTLTASIRIPNSIAPLELSANLRSRRVTCHFDIEAPREGRPATRVRWLVRQLQDAPETLRVEAFAARAREGTAELLRQVRLDPTILILDRNKELKSFRVAQVTPLGLKRTSGRGSFIDSIVDAIDSAYSEIGQRLKPWAPSPPKVRSEQEVDRDPTVKPSLGSAALSSQDGGELAYGSGESSEF